MATDWKEELQRLKGYLPVKKGGKIKELPRPEVVKKVREKLTPDRRISIFTRLRKALSGKGFYNFEKGILNAEVLEIAPELAAHIQKGLSWKLREDTYYFFRKVLNEIQSLAAYYGGKKKIDIEEFKIDIRLIHAEVVYEVAKGSVSRDFKQIFDICLDSILKVPSEKVGCALEGLKRFIESVYIFFYFQIKQAR